MTLQSGTIKKLTPAGHGNVIFEHRQGCLHAWRCATPQPCLQRAPRTSNRDRRRRAEQKPKGHFKMIGESDVRRTRQQNNRTAQTKTKEICHPARCMQPLRKITKSGEMLNKFIRATFKMIGQSELRKMRHQHNRTVHTKAKESCHPARCMRPLGRIAKSRKMSNQFIREIFEMIGQSEFRKKCLQNNRTVH